MSHESDVLLGFLGLPLAGAFTQLLLALERRSRGGCSRRVMVVLLAAAQRRAEQQVTNPGLNEGEGGAVRVSGGHHHLEGQRDAHKINKYILKNGLQSCCFRMINKKLTNFGF